MIVFLLTALGGCGLLVLAVWPGVLEDALLSLPFFCLSVPLLGCWFVLLVCLAIRDLAARQNTAMERRRWGLWSTAVMFVTMGLLWFHVPQRVAFALYGSEFRELARAVPANGSPGEELGRRVGPYLIDRFAVDRRGGIFFRTYIGPDGIGPDQMAYGFAFRPNRQGTPFGNAKYRRRHLFGDWYTFAVSDDW